MSYDTLLKVGISAGIFIFYWLLLFLSHSAINKFGIRQKFIEKRIIYIRKVFTLLFLTLLLITYGFVWGIDIRGLLIFASSFFAVMGIALFASWSILSNLTSGMVIFFSFPYKINDYVRIVDGDNSIEGTITDMSLFHIQIKNKSGNITYYPNNLAIQRPITRYPEKRGKGSPDMMDDWI